MFDYLIVGAGLFGSVCAHELHKRKKTCLVLEKRNHIGGNCYTTKKEGINIHEYGPHIFHTNSKKIWNYINSFAEFKSYTYSPVARYYDEYYSLPFNMWTFNRLWDIKAPDEALDKIKETAVIHSNPKNLEEWALSQLGKDVYQKLIYGYTKKQWMRDPADLPASIIKRLPLRLTYDSNYYNDRYCGIPIGGYTQIFESLLDGIEVKLGIDFNKDREQWQRKAKKTIYTGPIDAYFDYSLGSLDYRTLKFNHKTHNKKNIQGVAVINHTSEDVSWTRTIEHKHFENSISEKTVITHEIPDTWDINKIPYYPINDDKNGELYKLYRKKSESLDNVFFGGRLASYRYYDMDQVIAAALKFVKTDRL